MQEAVFWFILVFAMPSFGGAVEVKITAHTLDGCERLQKVVVRELRDRQMQKFTLRECPDGHSEEPESLPSPRNQVVP